MEGNLAIISMIAPTLITTQTPPMIALISMGTKNMTIELISIYLTTIALLLTPLATKKRKLFENGTDHVMCPLLPQIFNQAGNHRLTSSQVIPTMYQHMFKFNVTEQVSISI